MDANVSGAKFANKAGVTPFQFLLLIIVSIFLAEFIINGWIFCFAFYLPLVAVLLILCC